MLLAIADLETTTAKVNPNKTWVWLWGLKKVGEDEKMIWDISNEEIGHGFRYFFETVKREKFKYVMFHNLSFDGAFIFQWLLKNGYTYVDLERGRKQSGLPLNTWTWICDEQNHIYMIKLNYEGHVVNFWDSWKVLMNSVKDLGRSIELPKLDLKYDAYDSFTSKDEVPSKAVEYLERDIDIVLKTYSKAISIYGRKITRATMSYEHFKSYYSKQHTQVQFPLDFGGTMWNYKTKMMERCNVLSKEQWSITNKSFQGGYTFVNPLIVNQTLNVPNGISYDVNSLYPYVMENYKMPYGTPYHFKPSSGSYVALKAIRIQHAKLKDPSYPPLIKKRGGRYAMTHYLDEIKYQERVFWEEELRFLKKYYDMRYTEVKTLYFSTKFVFKDWINTVKMNKINAPNKVERDQHKLTLNSLFGKFAQSYKRFSRVIKEDGYVLKVIDGEQWLVDRDTNEKVVRLRKGAIRFGNEGEYKQEVTTSESDMFFYMPIGSYIPSKARLVLWKAIFENLDLWLYSDTDSCYFRDEPTNLNIHHSKFGAWGPEFRFNKFKSLRPKAYIFDSTHFYKDQKWVAKPQTIKKLSGLSREKRDLVNWENFKIGSVIPNGKTISRLVEGGRILVETQFQLGKESYV